MSCPTPELLIESFAATVFVVQRQTNGLTHSESLLQLPFQGNCLNWVIGHIIRGRNEALNRLGAEAVWDMETDAIYRTGSEPLTTIERAVPLEKLLVDLGETQTRLEKALEIASPEQLSVEIRIGEHRMTLAKRLSGLHWHETYHAGQLEILRQLAGKNDKIF